MTDLGIYENKVLQTFRANVSANCRRCSQDTKKIPKVFTYFLAKRSTPLPPPPLVFDQG